MQAPTKTLNMVLAINKHLKVAITTTCGSLLIIPSLCPSVLPNPKNGGAPPTPYANTVGPQYNDHFGIRGCSYAELKIIILSGWTSLRPLQNLVGQIQNLICHNCASNNIN